jgi:uncharacterized protein YjiK
MAAAPGAVRAQGGLRLLDSAPIAMKMAGFDEPSGLSLAAAGDGFWTVSDESSAVFFLGLDGALDPARRVETGAEDLEGVAEDAAQGRLLALSEREAAILAVDLATGAVSRHPLSSMEGWDAVAAAFSAGDANDGPEGVAVHPRTGAVFVLKERRPRLLLELTPDLGRIRGALTLDAARGFADEETDDDRLDVAGLAVDERRGGLWIVSDTGGRAFLLDLATLQARSWPLPDRDGRKAKRLKNAEGAALSEDGAVLNVVTDDGARSRLYRYAIEID